jgi:hypothetical protein
MSSPEYIDNIAFIGKIISDAGINIWTALQEVVISDNQIGDNVKTALYSILEEKRKITNKSPASFERAIKSVILDLQFKGWSDLGFTDRLLPALDKDLRMHLYGKLVLFLLSELQLIKSKIYDIETTGGLFPPVEEIYEEIEDGEYGYGYE